MPATPWSSWPAPAERWSGIWSADPGSRVGPGTRRTGDSGSVRAKVLSVFTDPREHTAGCIRIFADKKSGKDAERGELRTAMDYLRPGDTLIVSVPGPARPLPPGPHRDRRGTAQTRRRVPLAEGSTRHNHPRWPARLPRVRRAGGVHPRAHRQGHPRGPGCRPRPRAAPRPPARDDARAGRVRPRAAHPA